jgi:hypothetical protein
VQIPGFIFSRVISAFYFLDFYFSAAAAGLVLTFAAGLAAALVVCSDARSARVLTLLAALDRLRVFLRALVFGMGWAPWTFSSV